MESDTCALESSTATPGLDFPDPEWNILPDDFNIRKRRPYHRRIRKRVSLRRFPFERVRVTLTL
jgi:hypothetical protein